MVAAYCPQCTATLWSSVLTGAAIGAGSAALNGGNILNEALIGAFSGAVFFKIGHYFKQAENLNHTANNQWGYNLHGQRVFNFGGNLLTSGQIVSHVMAGGVISELNGGKFGHGFFSAGFTKGATGAFLPGGRNNWSGHG